MTTASTSGQGKRCVCHYARTSSTTHPASFPVDEVSGATCRVRKCLELYFYSTIRLHGLDTPLPLLHNTSDMTNIFRAPRYKKRLTESDILDAHGGEYGHAFFFWEVLPPSTRQYIRRKQHVHPSVTPIYKATMRHIS